MFEPLTAKRKPSTSERTVGDLAHRMSGIDPELPQVVSDTSGIRVFPSVFSPGVPFNTLRRNPTVIRRLLSDADVGALRQRGSALHDRIAALVNQTPPLFGQYLEEPLLSPIRNVNGHLQHPADHSRAGKDADLDAAETVIARVENFIQTNAAAFTRMLEIYNAETGNAAAKAQTFASVAQEARPMAARLVKGELRSTDLGPLQSAMENCLMPMGSKELQKMGRGDAVPIVLKLMRAGIVTVSNWKAAYASEYDKDEDAFGGSWKLEPGAASGKLQWVRTWEFHVHARVTRAAGPGSPVNGFTIHRAHIKPTAKQRETGQSIEVQDQAVLNHVQNDPATIGSLARWAATPKGQQVLAKSK